MNTNHANRLPLPEIVERMGGKFRYKDSHGSLWYNSPLRGDSDPSFHITEVTHPRLGKIWIWKDFGDEGGKVIDLIRKKYGTDVGGALRMLDSWGYGEYKVKLPTRPAPLLELIEAAAAPATPEQQGAGDKTEPAQEEESTSPSFSDVRVEELSNRALKGYLYGRGVDFWIAKPYVKEMHYTRDGKPFFALAFQNDLGDYELRNQYYKGVYGRKAITTLYCDKIQPNGSVMLFEGFIDFLSALAWYGTKPRCPVLILNSVEMRHEAARAIRDLGAGSIEAYPDNDDAGEKLMSYLRENLPGVYIEDKSGIYADLGYKDFNDMVKAEKARGQKQVMSR